MKFNKFLVVAAVATLSTACIKVPNQFVTLNNGKDGAVMPRKFREGSACSFLGLGDNSIAKAAQDAGVEKVVSSTFANYFGLISCTYVQGN